MKEQKAKPVQAVQASSEKPGERRPPPAVQPPVKAEDERRKAPGVGGVPSPVGENDLA